MKLWREMCVAMILTLGCVLACGQAVAKHATVKHAKPHARAHAKSAKKLHPVMVMHAAKSKPFRPIVKPYIPDKKTKSTSHLRRSAKFHPVIKPYLPAKQKPKKLHAKSGRVKLIAKKHTAKKTKIANLHPARKSHQSRKTKHQKKYRISKKHKANTARDAHSYTKQKLHANAAKVKAKSIAKNDLEVSLVPAKESFSEPALTQMKMTNINLAENKEHGLTALPLKAAVTNLTVTEDASGMPSPKKDSNTYKEKNIQSSQGKLMPLASPVVTQRAPIKKAKADAVLAGRLPGVKKLNPRVRVKEITSASVGIDPDKVNAGNAVHSIFMTVPQKKSAAQAIAGHPVVVNPRVASGVDDQSEKMIDKRDAAKQPVVKIVTADLSKNEFYILGENDPVPEYLAANPETQMVVFGGEMEEGAKKVMEFKLAALNAARARAAKELAEKTASAKVIAELEVEEREATARLAAAQKAVEDMQQLKKWQMEKIKNTAKITDNAAPEYKTSIVRAVVPEEIHDSKLANKPEDKLIPIDQVTLSAEKVADELGHDLPIVKSGAPVKAVAVMTREKEHGKTKSHPRRTANKIAEKQLNDAILDIKSAKGKKSEKKIAEPGKSEANNTSMKKQKKLVAKVARKHGKAKKLKMTKRKKSAKESIATAAGSGQANSPKVTAAEKSLDTHVLSKGEPKAVKDASHHRAAKANIDAPVKAKQVVHKAARKHSKAKKMHAVTKGKRAVTKIARVKKKSRKHIVSSKKKSVIQVHHVNEAPRELKQAGVAANKPAQS